jgi:hypothetical protein
VETYVFQFSSLLTIHRGSGNVIKRFKIEFHTMLSLSASKYLDSVAFFAQNIDWKKAELVTNPVLENRLIPKPRI